jgi:hypothetical protein
MQVRGQEPGMIKGLFLIALLPCLPYLIGCSFVPVRYMLVDVKSDTKLPLIDPNNGSLKMTLGGKGVVTFDTKPIINIEGPCKIKYISSPFGSCDIIVAGRLAKNYQCSVVIDTGCSVLCMLSSNIVRENNLPVYPVEGMSPGGGVCYLPCLKLGDAAIRDISSLYMNRQWELQLFGVPVNKTRKVLLGLGLMREFRYILFDCVHKELTLSAKQSFMPTPDSQWQQYPFKIEEDIIKNFRLTVDIPIEGNNYHIALDTGQSEALVVDTKFFDEFSKSVKVTARKQKLKQINYFTGWYDCQKVVLPELGFCRRKVKNAQIIIRPDDTAFKYPNFVGMQCFADTVFVLDFERELLWVKNKEIGKN